MLTRMSDSPEHDPRAPASADGSGVLAGLSRTRPQRASARRVASRAAKPSTAPAAVRTTETPKAPRSPTRNQTPKRKPPTAARATGTIKAPAATRAAGQRATPARPATKRKPRADSRPTVEPVPKQGFEAEPDTLGGPVQPPGGTELVASAAELAGELAKAGVNTGARVLRDFLSRLPG